VNQKDTNFKKSADDFVAGLMQMTKDMHDNLLTLSKENPEIITDFEKINAEANIKIKELNKELNNLQNKIKGL
jgi:hypothetical protein